MIQPARYSKVVNVPVLNADAAGAGAGAGTESRE